MADTARAAIPTLNSWARLWPANGLPSLAKCRSIQYLVVRLSEQSLFYRRFLEWRKIEYSDIVECERPVFPLFWGLHYLRLRNFEPPLGKLYFVQYHPAKLGSQYELDRALIEHIRDRIGG
jgi:hypothetical protein